jgi:uncharacterized HAD superfamily protein/adenine/guanine phosphoribosyltransferase-like PRPP-binding protein
VAAMDDFGRVWSLPDAEEKSRKFRDHKVNFRSLDQANQLIKNRLPRISGRFDLVIGVPRSGALLASIVALQLNTRFAVLGELPHIDLRRSFLSRAADASPVTAPQIRLLVVDDSTNTGGAMQRARAFIDALPFRSSLDVRYCAIYAVPNAAGIDLHFEVVAQPRIFEWNFLHHVFTKDMLFDLDGVICEDGPPEQTDAPEPYLRHLSEARPKILPRQPVGAIVTGRLEKYRPQTEAWLARHGVTYRYLIMVDLPSAEERRRMALHGKYKADVYTRLGGLLFVESETWQANQIASISQKPVYDLSTSRLLPGS